MKRENTKIELETNLEIGKLEKLKYDVYKCTGWLSEWTRCGFSKEVDEIERLDSWKVPDSLLVTEFFEEWEFVKHDFALLFAGKKKRKEREPKAGKKSKSPKRRKTDSPAIKKVVVKGQSGLHPDSGLGETYRIFFKKRGGGRGVTEESKSKQACGNAFIVLISLHYSHFFSFPSSLINFIRFHRFQDHSTLAI